MARLDVFLFGPFRVELAGRPLTAFESAKERALLAYLAAECAHPHRREVLAELLWPERPQGAALANLRHCLAELRHSLGDAAGCLLITQETLQFNPTGEGVDLARFAKLLAGTTPTPEHTEAALELYCGRLLEGFSLDDAPEFEHWVAAKREWVDAQAGSALARMVRFSVEHGDYAKAVAWTQRQLELEPWNEDLHRQAMWLLAQNGRRAAALHQFESCARLLADELDARPQPATLALAEQIRKGDELGPLPGQDGRPLAIVSAQARRARLHNFPVPPTPFVGREPELAQIAQRLAEPECQLLTIVAAGGAGKTRLAIQAAQDGAARYADGAWFVDLAPVASVRFIPSVMLRSLNAQDCDAAEAHGELLRYLRDRRLLMVLDNCEHLLDAGPLLDELLQAAPGLQVLATSRARLSLQREWLLPLAGLAVPQADQLLPPGAGVIAGNGQPQSAAAPASASTSASAPIDLDDYDATRLFVQCVRRLKPDFTPSPADAALIVQICRQLDGIPLAIELAAAWSRALSLAELAVEVEKSLGVLHSALQDMPARHRSMHAVFDQSWRLLAAGEQRLLRKLALFRGGFTRAAAESIAGATLPDLGSLTDESWLRLEPSGRYGMLELTRQYCAERLEADLVAPGDESPEQVRRRFCQYFGDFMHEEVTKTNYRSDVIDNLLTEFGNLQSAWEWTIGQGDLKLAYDMIVQLFFVAEMVGWYRFVLRAYDTMVEQLTPLTAPQANAGTRQAAYRVLAWIGYIRGCLYGHLGLLPEARAGLDEGREMVRHLEARADIVEVAAPLEWLETVILLREGKFDEAERVCVVAREHFAAPEYQMALYGEVSSRFWVQNTLHHQGVLNLALGNYAKARACVEQAIAICEQIGNVRNRAFSHGVVAIILLLQGEYEAALERAHEGLRLSSSFGDQIGVATAHITVGRVLAAQGQWVLAREHCQAGLTVARQTGNHDRLMDALVHLGRIELEQGNAEQVAALFMEAIHAFEQLGTPHSNKVAGALLGLGWAALAQGDLRTARSDFEQALAARGAFAWEHQDMQAGLAYVLAAENKRGAAAAMCGMVLQDEATAALTKGKVRELLEGLSTDVLRRTEQTVNGWPAANGVNGANGRNGRLGTDGG